MIIFLRKNEGVLSVVSLILLAIGIVFMTITRNNSVNVFIGSPIIRSFFSDSDVLISNWLNLLLIFPLAALEAILLNRTIQQEGLITKLSNFPLLVFVLLMFCVTAVFLTPLALIGTLGAIMFFRQSLLILYEVQIEKALFNASFIAGVLTLVYPFYFTLFVSLIPLLLITSSASLKRVLLCILAFLTPIYLATSFVFLIAPIHLGVFWGFLNPTVALSNPTPFQFGFFGIISLGLVMANKVTVSSSTLREKRKWYWVVVLFLALSSSVFLSGNWDIFILVTLVPSVIIISKNFVALKNKWLVRSIFYGLLGLSLINMLS